MQSTGKAAVLSGLKMGTRQAVGLILAETWFELRQQLPALLSEMQSRFDFQTFISRIKDTLQGIWRRVRVRFYDFLKEFKDGAVSGALASLSSTLINIFKTTQKLTLKIIRECWNSIVKAIKLIFFNPQKLGLIDVCKELVGIFFAAASLALGSTVNAELQSILVFPLGSELAAFAGALVTGLCTIGLAYVCLHSELAQKVWHFLEEKMPHAATLAEYQAANHRLDQYLEELTRQEFNMNPVELEEFTYELRKCNSELEKSFTLGNQAEHMKIELPFKPGDAQSFRQHLANIIK